MNFSGERYIPEVHGNIELEHLHRYFLACEIASGKDVLDIACGEGYGSDMLASKAKKVTGVDISPEAIQHARSRYQKENLEFLVGSCTDIPLLDSSVDLVVSFETIEHLEQHDLLMKEIKRVLRPDGVLVISSPDKYYYSIEPGFKNSFHVKELYLHEFKQLLSDYFKHSLYYGQRIIYGSTIASESVPTIHLDHLRENERINTSQGISKPVYWVALASDNQLPEVASSVFECPINDSEIVHDWSRVVRERDQTIQDLISQVSERDQAMQNLMSQMAEREQAVVNFTTSKKWKVAQALVKIQEILAPPNSLRLRILKTLYQITQGGIKVD